MNEIGDISARLVLGDVNMDEWNHARFMLTMDIMYWSISVLLPGCANINNILPSSPHKGCSEPFDVNDVAPAQSGKHYASGYVQVGSFHMLDYHDAKLHPSFPSAPSAGRPYVKTVG